MKANSNSYLSKNAILIALHRNDGNVKLLRIGNELDEIKSYYLTSNTIGLDDHAILLITDAAKNASELVADGLVERMPKPVMSLVGIEPFVLSEKGKKFINVN